MTSSKEKVLVFDKELMAEFVDLPGVSKSAFDIGALFRTCLPQSFFIARERAETDESMVQIIPYVIVQYHHLYGTYKRTTKGGEARLHNKYSIGLGGHVNLQDLEEAVGDPKNLSHGGKSCQEGALLCAMRREIFEEVSWASDLIGKPRMLIYDDRDAVGRVHLGVVLIMQPKSIPEDINTEEEIGDFSWKSKKALMNMEGELESWSRLCLHQI